VIDIDPDTNEPRVGIAPVATKKQMLLLRLETPMHWCWNFITTYLSHNPVIKGEKINLVAFPGCVEFGDDGALYWVRSGSSSGIALPWRPGKHNFTG